MPSRKNSKPPPETMTWWKAAPVLAVCVVFDALRFFFEMFWFFGPTLAAAVCAAKGADLAGKAGAVAGGFLCGAAGTALSSGFEAFGVVMAMAIGLFGWLVVLLLNLLNNRDIFKENFSMLLKYGVGLLVSETPLINALPALTIVNTIMFRVQIQKGKEVLKKYAAENAAAQFQERRQRVSEFMREQSARLVQAEQATESSDATNREQSENNTEAAETPTSVRRFPSERTRERTPEEIPEELREAA